MRADGRALPIGERARTPFAIVTFFEPNLSRKLDTPMDLGALCSLLDRLVGGEASCYAVRVDGSFDRVKTRSVPASESATHPSRRSWNTSPPSNFGTSRAA